MTFGHFLMAGWRWEPSVVAGCGLLLAAYGAVARPLGRRALAFGAGWLVLLLSLVSPLDALGDTYLFSAHMVQHLLLTLVAPPLLLLGFPGTMVARLLRIAALGRVERTLAQPIVAWALALGALWVWHLPTLYNAALLHEGVHIAQHQTFLVTGAIFWWPIVAPREAGGAAPVAPWVAALYLFCAMAASSVLGIILAFAPPGLYPFYRQPPDSYGLLRTLREGWGLSLADDQQLGGALMWIPGSVIYSLALFGVLARWFGEADPESRQTASVARESA